MKRSLSLNLIPLLRGTALKRGAFFGGILLAALGAFEIFNYSTTLFALTDVLGDLRFAGVRWAAILAIAFCGIDFAGIARLFTPERGRSDPAEAWYLFAAWFLAASFNAILTWWGISVAILNNAAINSNLVGQVTLTKTVPVFIAVMVWLIRVLVIGTFSLAGENLFSQAESSDQPYHQPRSITPKVRPELNPVAGFSRPAPKPNYVTPQPAAMMPHDGGQVEPTYHPAGMSARQPEHQSNLRN
jgi:hypothetical protein